MKVKVKKVKDEGRRGQAMTPSPLGKRVDLNYQD